MRNAIALTLIVIAAAPLIGAWRGHIWAKANGMVLQKALPHIQQTSQTSGMLPK